jgi:hypothetical protein
MKKRELEAIHQLSKNMYVCIGHAYSMITNSDQLKLLLDSSNLVRRISTHEMI